MDPKCIMIVAGEASGDLHGAKLVSAMRQQDPSLFFCGMGDEALQAAGVRISVKASTLSVVGISEIFAKLALLLKGFNTLKRLLTSLRPELLILIDFPDFNLRLAAVAKKLGIPVLYYISPQVWAWRRGRVHKIRKRVDHMAVILPFEKDFYERHGVPVTFVGHPLLDAQKTLLPITVPEADENLIGLLPGSRDTEISRLMPVMLQAARILKAEFSHMRFVVSKAPSVSRQCLENMIDRYGQGLDVELEEKGVAHIFKRCRLAVVASGTATLEAAIYGMPMVVIYRVSVMTSWIGRFMIKGVSFISLANLIAGKALVPELIQKDASAEGIARAASKMLKDEPGLLETQKALMQVGDSLGGAGASARVAKIALEMVLA